jgi:hypothetical protein
MNLLWENNTLRIRDLHLFDENFPSVYTNHVATSNECTFFTLPIVDGYLWSKPGELAGLRLKAIINGQEMLLSGGKPRFTHPDKSTLHVSWPLTTIKGSVEIDLSEKLATISLKTISPTNWFFDLNTVNTAKLPFESIQPKQIICLFEGTGYRLNAIKGTFFKPDSGAVLRIKPKGNVISLDLSVLPLQ